MSMTFDELYSQSVKSAKLYKDSGTPIYGVRWMVENAITELVRQGKVAKTVGDAVKEKMNLEYWNEYRVV